MDNQIRPTSSSIPVDDIILILLCDRRKLSSASGGPTVFPQERSKVCSCFAFLPSVPQGSAPPASGLEICGRGRVDDYPDGVCAVLLAKSEQFANTPSPRFCLISFASVEHTARTRQRDSRRTQICFLQRSTSVPILSTRELSFEAAGLNQLKFSGRKTPPYRCGKKRSPESNWMVVNEPTALGYRPSTQ